MTAGGVAAGAGGTAVLSAAPVAPATPTPPRGGVAPPDGRRRGAASSAPPRGATSPSGDTVPRTVRIIAWLVALPLGLVIVGLPARKAGYLTSQKLLDVIVKHDISRFVPILVVVLLWALVTAILVTVFVEGTRRIRTRRHAAHALAT